MDPEKKKTIVVGSLFVAMLGIGAFQFTKGGEEPAPAAPATAKSEAETKDAEKKAKDAGKPKNPMYAGALPARDPFRPAPFSAATPEPAAPVNPTPATPAPKIGGGTMPLPLGGGAGALLPMNPTDTGNPGTPIVPVAPPEPVFDGTLIGVVVGVRSAAVFRIGGSDRIVSVGGEIEPGVRLISVRSRRAVVRFHGKTLQLGLKDEAPIDSAPSDAPAKAPASSTNSSLNVPTSAPTPPQTGPSETSND